MKVMSVVIVTGLMMYCSDMHEAFADTPLAYNQHVGRYQIAVRPDGTVFVLDTATGQCWSKTQRGDWRNEGNPTRVVQAETRARRDDSPLSLVLPQDKVELTIKQRQSKPIPGSKDRIIMRLDDITGGQVLISVRSQDGKVLLDQVSVEQGEVFDFPIGKKNFYCRVKELKNFVIGEDIAIVEIASSLEAVQVKGRTRRRGKPVSKSRD